MLNEKLMEVLSRIQGGLGLEPEEKLAYALIDNFTMSACSYCDGTCHLGCQNDCLHTCRGIGGPYDYRNVCS